MSALDRPVVVTGTPRSGKTRVWRILASAQEFGGPEQEPIMIWDAGIRGPDDCRGAEMATPEVRRRIVSKLEDCLEPPVKTRYFDNLSYHALRVPFVAAVIPAVRIVHIVRDPVSCVPEMLYGWTAKARVLPAIDRRRSGVDLRAAPRLAWTFLANYARSRLHGVRKTWGPVVPGLAAFARNRGPAEIAAFQWKSMVEIARRDFALLSDHQVLELRYESLVSNPGAEVRRLAEFVGARDPDAMVEFGGSDLDPAKQRDDRIRREPTDDEWRAILSIVGKLRGELGYDSAPPPARASDRSCG